MKNWKLLTAMLLVAALLLSGCGGGGEQSTQTNPGDDSAQTTAATTLDIVDDAGRTVTIPTPENLNKVYFTSPIGMIMVYTLAPEKMAGTPMELSEDELTYLDPLCRDLTYLGGMQSGAEMNKELIVDSGAQIIFSMGPGKINEAAISSADELQEQINIPVVVVSGIFEDMPKSYQLMGKIFGMEERATALADYCDKVLTDVMGAVATVPEEKRISVYYAEQADGLCTEPETSGHAAAFSYANALNVATVEGKGGSGLTPVSLEQVLAWDPQVIITWGDERGGAYSLIKSSPDWSKISAVQNGRIYAMPNVPFSWIDRPPSVNRFLGVQWIANLLYPDVYDVDIVAVAQEFYKLFYHIDLTPEQLHDLLANSIDKK